MPGRNREGQLGLSGQGEAKMIGDTDFQRAEASEQRVRKRFRTARHLQWGDLSKQRHVSQRPLGNGAAGPGVGGRCVTD